MTPRIILSFALATFVALGAGTAWGGVTRAQGIPASAVKIIPASATGTSAEGALQERTIKVGALTRSYYIYAPANKKSGAMPLVVAFHGGGGGALQFAERMKLVDMAQRHGMILVVPQGQGAGGNDEGGAGSWNAASTTPTGYAERKNVDDIGFVKALIGTVSSEYKVDPRRIYAVGYSKGGMMAYHAACTLKGAFTAIAVVSATLSSATCAYPAGVSVLHIHGTDDQNVPFAGGAGEFTARRANWPPVSSGLALFKSGNACAAKASESQPASDTSCSTQNCGGNETVELCLVKGGGHGWPGSPPAKWQVRRNVYVSQKFNATEYIANFLASH